MNQHPKEYRYSIPGVMIRHKLKRKESSWFWIDWKRDIIGNGQSVSWALATWDRLQKTEGIDPGDPSPIAVGRDGGNSESEPWQRGWSMHKTRNEHWHQVLEQRMDHHWNEIKRKWVVTGTMYTVHLLIGTQTLHSNLAPMGCGTVAWIRMEW